MPGTDEPASVPFEVSERDKDLMARTLYGEASWKNPRAQAAVAQVIVNRALADGYPGTVGDVVLQRGQFEPWANRRGELLSLPMDSAAYRQSLQTVNDVLAGNVPDMTGGATHFYAPKAQAALGRPAPEWARDPLAQEGGHVFYAPHGRVDRAVVGMPLGTGPASWATLDEAGVMPRSTGAAPSQPKAVSMPTKDAAAADDIMAMYGLAPVEGKAAGAAPTPVVAPAPKSPVPTAKAAEDDIMALYGLTGDLAAKPGQPSPAPAANKPAVPMPLPGAEGVIDGNTGEPVVGGKGFSDNRTTAGGPVGNAGQAVADGALLGAAVPIQAFGAALKEKLLHGGDFSNLYDQARSVYGGAREQYRAENPGTNALMEMAGSIPTTTALLAAGGAGLAVPGNALVEAAAGSRLAAPLAAAGKFVTGGGASAGGLGARLASKGVAGATAGAAGGALNTSLTGGDIGSNALTGAVVGGAIGSALPAVGAAASSTFNRLTGSAFPEAAVLARRAQELGLPVRAAEISDSPLLRGADTALSKVPGMGYGGIDAAKQTALNGQIAGLMGENGTKITPALMQSAKTRLGQTFDRIEKNTWVRQDDEFAGDLQTIFRDASEALDGNQISKLQKVFKGIQSKFDPATGEMEGSAYQNLTRKGSPLDLMQGGDDTSLSHFAGRLKTALTGAFERSAPDDLAAELRQARNQYRVMKVIEPLVQDTGGSIDPAAFRAAVAKATDGMAYGRGGDLADLARVAQAFGPREAGSATASRDALGMAAKIAALTGGAATTAAGLKSVAPALATAAAGYAVPSLGSAAAGFAGGRIASQVLRSPALANRLIDRALGTGQAGPINRLASVLAGSAPEAAAPLYLRVRPANDDTNANRLAEFLANRSPQRAGMLP